MSPDYGVDGVVEIFSPSGRATGLLFFVQLKSTGDVFSELPFRVNLPLHTYSYYKTLIMPVLLVLFHASTKCLYAKWIPDIPKHARNRKSVSILFRSTDTWDLSRLIHIRRTLSGLRQSASDGERNSRINRYYSQKAMIKLESKSHRHLNQTFQFAKGNKLFHPVFGYGNIDDVSDNYMFVKFDKDEFLRKFIPGSFSEFTIINTRTSRDRWTNKSLKF